MDKAIPTANRAARPIWGSRGDRDDFSMPLATVKVGSGEIRAMIERAENTKQAVRAVFSFVVHVAHISRARY